MLEQEILAQYEDSQHFTEKAITAAIESLQTDDVVCPLCLKLAFDCLVLFSSWGFIYRNVLCQTNEIIHCQCGLSIDTAVSFIAILNIIMIYYIIARWYNVGLC